MKTTNNERFFTSLIKNAAHFDNLLKEANEKDSRLKFVAKFENGKASVGLAIHSKRSSFL